MRKDAEMKNLENRNSTSVSTTASTDKYFHAALVTFIRRDHMGDFGTAGEIILKNGS
jgi:hypothetical protein